MEVLPRGAQERIRRRGHAAGEEVGVAEARVALDSFEAGAREQLAGPWPLGMRWS